MSRRIEVYPGRDAIIEFDPTLTFDCIDDCTWCCHHGVYCYYSDLEELANYANLEDATTTFRGERFIRRESQDHDHTATDGSSCRFLTEEGRCSLHATHDWKPTRCAVYPLAVEREGDALVVELRESAPDHCDGLHEGDQRLIDRLPAFLPPVLWELEEPASDRVLGR